MKMIRWPAALAAALLAPALAHAGLYKCTGPDGKVVFSDTRCESADKGDAAKAPAAPAKPAAPGGRYQLTDADNERLRKLAAESTRPGLNADQTTAVNLEMSAIRSGQDARLTPEKRARRDALTAQLADPDPKKRKDSLNAIRELYSGY